MLLCNKYIVLAARVRGYLLPRDLQVEFNGPEVVDVHSHHLRHGSEQLLGLTDHAAHQHVSGEALQLRHLIAPHTASIKHLVSYNSIIIRRCQIRCSRTKGVQIQVRLSGFPQYLDVNKVGDERHEDHIFSIPTLSGVYFNPPF